MNWIPIITTVLKHVYNVIDEYITNQTEREELKRKLQEELLIRSYEYITKELETKRDIIVAEAKSDSFLTRTWRPITMLTFLFLIVSYWFGYTIPNIPYEALQEIFSIIKIGLGGYIVGRSGEKIASGIITYLHSKELDKSNRSD